MVKYLGIDIGGTKCALVTADEEGRILCKERFATEDYESTLRRIIDTARELIAGEKPSAIGISCGGPLDARRGMILSPPNLPGWDEVPITRIMTDELGIPAYLCNDANACALAEHEFGAGRGCDDMIFLTFGTGMGAGIISGGRLLDGACGNAGECGHMRLSPDGPWGFGKDGSFEGWCSGGGIVKLARFLAKCTENSYVPSYMLDEYESRELLNSYEKTAPAWIRDTDLSTARICELADAGDTFARTVIRISARKLGQALSILIDVINPEKIVIGSVFTRREDMFREEMEKAIAADAIPASAAVCSVVPASLGESLGDYAAIAVARVGERRKDGLSL
ncbi:MAG: ROK family protein [Lachnospiraceae bacterium]|nr:ROK family protein [Lachnospiraceae bacterium]